MGLPHQDMRLIPLALSALVGAWLALNAADWNALSLLSGISLACGVLLLILSAWLSRGIYRRYARHVLFVATMLGVFGITCANIIHHHPRGAITHSDTRIATVSGTIASRPEPEKLMWSQGQCRITVAVEDLRVGSTGFHYYAPSLPFFSDVAHQLGYPYHSALLVQLRSADCSALIGQKVRSYGKISSLPGDRKEGAQLFVSDMSLDGEGAWAAQRVRDIDRSLTALLASHSAHVQGLLPGVALGDDTRVSVSLSEAMRITQLTHLIAVSGGHISILMGIILSFVGRKKPALSALVCLVALGGLVVLVGAQPSVMRAFLMSLVVLLSFVCRRASQATPAWSVAIIVMVIFNPWLALSYGFLLSASATIGIVLVGVPLACHIQKVCDEYVGQMSRALPRVLPHFFRGRDAHRQSGRASHTEKLVTFLSHGFAIPLAAQLFCTPVLLLFTSESSVWGVLANVLVAPVVAPLTVFGLLVAVSAPIFSPLASACVYPAQLCTWWIDSVARTLGSFYGSGIPMWLAGFLSLCILGAAVCVRRKKLAAALMTPIVLLIGMQWLFHPHASIPENWQVIQCDVGQGSALLARVNGKTVMVDVGGEDSGVEACLNQAEVSHIDLLILSHMHDDHVGGLAEVLNVARVGRIWVSPNVEPAENGDMLRRLASAAQIPIETVWRGHNWGQSVHIISPRAHPNGDPNADSLVVQIDTAGGVLVMGDADGEVQIPIASRVSHVHVIVVAHHGSSRQEEALASAANADIALISVGENSYGHPSETALHLYGTADIYDTHNCGTIALTDTEVFSECATPVG